MFLDLLRSETGADAERMKRALDGLRRYQEFRRAPPPQPMPIVAERQGAAVRDYGGPGPPVLFVPSLINPPSVLDLSEERSLLRWLAARGHHVLLLDWGWPDARRSGLSVTAHIEQILLPLVEELGERPALVGYCLGGTMALGAARAAGTPAVAAIAAPWHFAGFPDVARSSLAALWKGARGTADALGMLPMEVLQSAFWSLDPARTVAKFESFVDAEGAQAEAFVTLEDWANDGPPLAAAAARELFEDFFAGDVPGRGAWRVAGEIAIPAAIPRPVLDIVSTVDRIVPAATAAAAGERLELGLGHVGMVVGGRAREALWEPLDRWLLQGRPSC